MKSFSARVIAECTVNVERPVEDLYTFWRNFENLTEVFTRIRDIRSLGPIRARWFAEATDGTTIQWETEIVADRPNQAIAWRSGAESHLLQEGFVRFRAVETGTLVTVSIRYGATGLELTDQLEKIFGRHPTAELEHDLKRFRERMAPLAGVGPDRCPPFPFPSGMPPIEKRPT